MKNKKYKIEFHVHTSISKDSFLSKIFLFFMCKIKGINCVAITDHNEIQNAIEFKPFFEKRGINVIIGEEILTKQGEVIGLFLNKKIEPNASLKETIEEIKKQNGLIYIPHPYDKKRNKTVISYNDLEKIEEDIDFIECHNGRNISFDYSQNQEEIADKLNLIKLVGSDAHTFYEIGRNYCIVNSIDKNKLKNEIKKAKFKKSKCIKFAHFNTKLVRALKLIKGGKWNELSRIINKKIKRNK